MTVVQARSKYLKTCHFFEFFPDYVFAFKTAATGDCYRMIAIDVFGAKYTKCRILYNMYVVAADLRLASHLQDFKLLITVIFSYR